MRAVDPSPAFKRQPEPGGKGRDIQTVNDDIKLGYHALILVFERKTKRPVILNTAFNVRGEPIMCAPEDAFRCFMGNELVVLAVGDCYLRIEEYHLAVKQNHETAFESD